MYVGPSQRHGEAVAAGAAARAVATEAYSSATAAAAAATPGELKAPCAHGDRRRAAPLPLVVGPMSVPAADRACSNSSNRAKALPNGGRGGSGRESSAVSSITPPRRSLAPDPTRNTCPAPPGFQRPGPRRPGSRGQELPSAADSSPSPSAASASSSEVSSSSEGGHLLRSQSPGLLELAATLSRPTTGRIRVVVPRSRGHRTHPFVDQPERLPTRMSTIDDVRNPRFSRTPVGVGGRRCANRRTTGDLSESGARDGRRTSRRGRRCVRP